MRNTEQKIQEGWISIWFLLENIQSKSGQTVNDRVAQRWFALSIPLDAEKLMSYEQPDLTSELDFLSWLVLLWGAGWTRQCLEDFYT